MPPERRPWLAHPQDVHCLVFHACVLACFGLAFALWSLPGWSGLDTTAERIVFVAVSAPLLGWVAGIDLGVVYHNHAHRAVFTRRFANRWIARTWGLPAGWPAPLWRHAHVRVHHRHLLGPDDWSVPRRRADGRFEPLWRYALLHWPWRTVQRLAHDLRHGRLPASEVAVEGTWFVLLWSVPFWIDPWMATWLWALPAVFANQLTLAVGMYVQHAGCEPSVDDRRHPHSNDFTSAFYNRTMFNIGFHAAHHEGPRVHWTDLPAVHGAASDQNARSLKAAESSTLPRPKVGQLRQEGWSSPEARERRSSR